MLTATSIFTEWWFSGSSDGLGILCSPSKKDPFPALLLCYSLGPIAHILCMLISQCVTICLCTINPATGHGTVVVFRVSSGKLCVVAAVQSEVHVGLVTALSDRIWVANVL